MELALVLFVVYMLGMVIGFEWGQKYKRKQREAPTPDYDVTNPINGVGQRWETVEICGHTFWRVN